MQKLKNWLHVMTHTQTVSAPFLYFQVAYFTLTLTTVIGKLKLGNPKKLRTRVERWFDKEIVIKNELGVFSVNPKNDSLTKSITSFEYAHQAWLETPAEKRLFIDIGANIGFYSILALQRYGYQKAFAFEPNPPTHRRLSHNVELNELTQSLTAVPVGLSDTNGTASLEARASHTGASSFVHTNAAEHETINVQTDRFDDVATANNIDVSAISFIKIDVEGHERQVLLGMSATLAALAPDTCLFIEIHPRSPEAVETHKLITSAGFVEIKRSAQNNFLYQKEVQ